MSQEILKDTFMFSKLSDDELKVLNEVAKTDTHRGGERVFEQGDEATAMYFIKYGSVRIKQSTNSGDDINIALLGRGAHFGEMGFIDHSDRSATAEVLEQSEIIRIEYDELAKLFEQYPLIGARFHQSVAQFLANRLRSTTSDLTFARVKNLQKA